MIKLSMDKLSEDTRPYYKDFINQDFTDKAVKPRVVSFICDNLLKLKQHQNTSFFAMSRFAYFHEIWIADKKKFKVMKKELSYLSSKQKDVKKFTNLLLEELCLA